MTDAAHAPEAVDVTGIGKMMEQLVALLVKRVMQETGLPEHIVIGALFTEAVFVSIEQFAPGEEVSTAQEWARLLPQLVIELAGVVVQKRDDTAFERYLRNGDLSGLPTKVLAAAALDDIGYQAPPRLQQLIEAAMTQCGRTPEGDGSALYANLAATQTLLEDPNVDVFAWLAQECAEAFKARTVEGVTYGPARVLRDPYSAKPYTLFYVTRAPIGAAND